jgi:ADP-ribose pyrophosphatase
MKRWKVLNKERLAENEWLAVDKEVCDTPHGRINQYLVRKKDFSCIIALHNNKIMFLKEYRCAVDQFLLNLPMGYIDKGETSLASAKKELLEESGFRAKSWKPLGFMYPASGFLTQRVYVFLAQDLTKATIKNQTDTGEYELYWLDFSQAMRKVEKGEITEMTTVAALFLGQKYLK